MACDIFLTLSNGAKLPALGYGTWQASGGVLERALEEALTIGYRYIDTAQAYQNEEIVGRVLKRWFDSGKLNREDIFVTTKLSPYSMAPDTVEENLKTSLEKLQLDYVDLYLLHFPVGVRRFGNEYSGRTDFHYLHVWKKLEEQHDAGRAKAIGIANFNLVQVKNIVQKCRIKPANYQIEMHIYYQQSEVIDYCNKNDITITAYSSLERSPNFTIDDEFDSYTVKILQEMAEKYSKKPAQVLLRFMLELGVSTIPKTVSIDRIKENYDIFDFKLDDEDLAKLKDLNEGEGGTTEYLNWGRLSMHPEYPYKLY